MSNELAQFYELIAPFRHLWRTLKITVAAVLHQGRWIALCSRLSLSDKEPGPDLRIQPAEYFVVLSSSRPASELEHVLGVLHKTGALQLAVGDRVDEQVYVTLAHAGLEAPAHPVQFFCRSPSWRQPHQKRLSVGGGTPSEAARAA